MKQTFTNTQKPRRVTYLFTYGNETLFEYYWK